MRSILFVDFIFLKSTSPSEKSLPVNLLYKVLYVASLTAMSANLFNISSGLVEVCNLFINVMYILLTGLSSLPLIVDTTALPFLSTIGLAASNSFIAAFAFLKLSILVASNLLLSLILSSSLSCISSFSSNSTLYALIYSLCFSVSLGQSTTTSFSS